ncbi:MAG: hypothetical protein HY674_13340 [Chloroflexi bacterium]|nr:hypothetical protein [Chloroflexota bacterium]
MKNNSLPPLFLALAGLAVATQPILVADSFVKNPSFESNYNDVFPHYSAVDEWPGASGVNESGGPFHNGGTPIPDQRRVAFKQGSGDVSQDIVGLTAGKQYWIQFFYDARNCCGGTIDLITKFNGVELDKVANVKPSTGGAPYKFRNVPFKPDVETGTLTLTTVSVGDATIVLDAVTIVQRDEAQANIGNLPVMNPSFEASGVVADPGILAPDGLAGWTGEGQYGVASLGTSNADNGAVPDQDNVAFIAGAGSLSQVAQNLVAGTEYTVTVAYNAKTGTQPHLQLKVGDAMLFEEDVTPVGGANPYRTKSAKFTATDVLATLTLAQTKDGSDVLLLDDVRVVGQVSEIIPPLGVSPTKAELGPGQKGTITLTVPTQVLAVKAVDIKLRIGNVNVATLVGADAEGILTVHYDKGGANVKTFDVEGVGRGLVRVEFVETTGINVVNDVGVDVVTSFVLNSSFESTEAPGGVGYGAILAWVGGSGLNKAAGPFHDNGVIPDRDQIAFLQGAATLSQQISGLTPGQNYWLQFYYNIRNCCPPNTPDFSMDLSVKFAGKEVAKIEKIAPVGEQNPYYFKNIEFKPDSSSGLLEFVTTPTGDATLLLDGVNIVQRDPGQIVVQNPSFEGTGSPVGVGYIQPRRLGGWEITGGGYGVNITGVGPFTSNGSAPDQDRVLFVQGAVNASQNITGLTADQKYTVIYAVNSRNGNLPYGVFFDDQPLLEEEITPVGGTEPYPWRALVFTPAASEGVLRFSSMPEAGADRTLLLDDIRIVPGEVPPPPPRVSLGIQALTDGNVRLSWPSTASDFVLQFTHALPGGWADSTASVNVEGDEFVVLVQPVDAATFYRLRK